MDTRRKIIFISDDCIETDPCRHIVTYDTGEIEIMDGKKIWSKIFVNQLSDDLFMSDSEKKANYEHFKEYKSTYMDDSDCDYSCNCGGGGLFGSSSDSD